MEGKSDHDLDLNNWDYTVLQNIFMFFIGLDKQNNEQKNYRLLK